MTEGTQTTIHTPCHECGVPFAPGEVVLPISRADWDGRVEAGGFMHLWHFAQGVS
ncbi:hypothetical protein GCM10023351_18510 [Microbacterium gilvum]|uniref:Uncharacterized protein n=1 Tax=Microbacterium gilvum TaxID=1336204 RepID=A0ABP9A5W8_9MICO